MEKFAMETWNGILSCLETRHGSLKTQVVLNKVALLATWWLDINIIWSTPLIKADNKNKFYNYKLIHLQMQNSIFNSSSCSRILCLQYQQIEIHTQLKSVKYQLRFAST